MSRQLETLSKNSAIARAVINCWVFARDGKRLCGSIPLGEFSRLADLLVDTDGVVECGVDGERDQDGKSYLLLELRTSLNLQCQRCLGTVVVPINVANRFLLVPAGQPLPDEELAEDGFDAIEAEDELALLPLIEDELLLALPIAPRHPCCEPPVSVVDEDEPSPFAVLGKLKKGV